MQEVNMKRHQRAWIFVLGLLVALPLGVSQVFGAPHVSAPIEPVMACSELAEMSFGPGVFIDSALTVAAAGGLPAHCEVKGIRFYDAFIVKLPDRWNGRYYQAGNGGAAGSFGDVSMGLKNGFVAASGSGGHTDPRLFNWAYPPEDLEAQLKLDDYCDGSVHKTMIIGKRILNAYYGRTAKRSYYNSCSTGGRQGLMEAQRYPYDFDGIVVGAPVNYLTRITQRGIWEAQALLPIGGNFAPGKLQLLSEKVMAACDGSDGLVDGLISEPRECGFNALTDLPACPGDVSDEDCFTLAERTAIQKIYTGPPGEAATPGQAFGSEAVANGMFGPSSGWAGWVTPVPPFLPFSLGFLLGAGFVQWAALPPSGGGGPSWDWTAYDFYGDDPGLVIDNLAPTCDATDPNLSLFRANGGKMIMWGGWADPATGPYQWVQYYESVLSHMGYAAVDSFFKLYMIPGLQHCGGGLGCFDNQEDLEKLFFAVIDWVEKGKEPKSFTGSRIDPVTGAVLRTRPLCPYPQTARYHGRGSIDDADNFSCVGRRPPKHRWYAWECD
jgi:hypothetical protein